MKKIVGFDITTDANIPLAVCVDCAEDYDGEPILEGSEWGGDSCICHKCGHPLAVVLIENA